MLHDAATRGGSSSVSRGPVGYLSQLQSTFGALGVMNDQQLTINPIHSNAHTLKAMAIFIGLMVALIWNDGCTYLGLGAAH